MFREKALENIPTHSREEIEAHTEWYQQYTVLREKKRQAIRRWKTSKQVLYNFLFPLYLDIIINI